MARKKNLLSGIDAVAKGIGSAFKGKVYKETKPVRGRIARALAKEAKGGKGKISSRASYKKKMKHGYAQTRKQDRAKIDYALARNTKGGKGRIAKRTSYKKHLGK